MKRLSPGLDNSKRRFLLLLTEAGFQPQTSALPLVYFLLHLLALITHTAIKLNLKEYLVILSPLIYSFSVS